MFVARVRTFLKFHKFLWVMGYPCASLEYIPVVIQTGNQLVWLLTFFLFICRWGSVALAGLGILMELLSGGGGGRTCYVLIWYDVFCGLHFVGWLYYGHEPEWWPCMTLCLLWDGLRTCVLAFWLLYYWTVKLWGTLTIVCRGLSLKVPELDGELSQVQ